MRRPARGRRRHARLGVFVAAVLSAMGAIAAPSPAANDAVQAWQTSVSGSNLVSPLTARAPLAFGGEGTTSTVVTVDPSTTYQTIDGFGGALTDAAASLIYASPERNQIMQALFGSSGAALSVVRLPI